MATENPTAIYEAPHIAFPDNPSMIHVGGYDVFDYIDIWATKKIIDRLAEQINFSDYEGVIVNMNGGRFLATTLMSAKGYTGSYSQVEYHRPKSGVGVEITIPVPEALKGKRCLVIDDVSDRGDTFIGILESLSPDSTCVALVSKKDIPNKKDVPNLLIGVLIDGYVWIGGCGMDIGLEGEKEMFRNWPGIVVKIPKEVDAQGKWIY